MDIDDRLDFDNVVTAFSKGMPKNEDEGLFVLRFKQSTNEFFSESNSDLSMMTNALFTLCLENPSMENMILVVAEAIDLTKSKERL